MVESTGLPSGKTNVTPDRVPQQIAFRGAVALRRSFSDADEQAAWAPNAHPQRYEQIGAGAFYGEITKVDLDGVLVVRERANRRMLQFGVTQGFTLAWLFSQSIRYRCNGHDLGTERVMLWNDGSEFEIQCDPSDICAVTVSAQAFAAWNGYPLDSEDPDISRGIRVVPPALARDLHVAVGRALEVVVAAPSWDESMDWKDSLRDHLLRIVMGVAGQPLPISRRLRGRARTFKDIVRRASELIADDPTGALSIHELCLQVGASRRNLHSAFMAMFGTPPGQYLRALRLNAVRRAIKARPSSDTTITEIASRFGFDHPSRFMAAYKRQFRERPSDTARPAVRLQCSSNALL